MLRRLQSYEIRGDGGTENNRHGAATQGLFVSANQGTSRALN